MKSRVVIGANFGDEGKGLVTDWLCAQGADFVVRFNGGANAGHTVVTPEGLRHVFKHFGSGTLQGVPTYLSQFFICNPILFFEELRELVALGLSPVVAAHPDCLITTHVDMLVNQEKERQRSKRHGSCGVGIHETHQRSQVPNLKITLGDLWNGVKIEDRLREIGTKWAGYRVGKDFHSEEAVEAFSSACHAFADYVQPMGISRVGEAVFEGAQGLLLSQDNAEFRPHLTHSYTGMHNVRILCEQAKLEAPEIYYVSRTYLTRHGMGPLPGESSISYHDDTNNENPWQGPLRFAPLDGRLRERIAKDAGGPHKLVMTHCDQLEANLWADFYSHGSTRDDISAAVMA